MTCVKSGSLLQQLLHDPRLTRPRSNTTPDRARIGTFKLAFSLRTFDGDLVQKYIWKGSIALTIYPTSQRQKAAFKLRPCDREFAVLLIGHFVRRNELARKFHRITKARTD